jgi:hypothetical protein
MSQAPGSPASGDCTGAADAPAARPAARPKLRHKRYPLMNQLSAEQVGLFRTIANTYIPDMYDPAAVEVLLVLLEICHVLDLTPGIVARIFGARVLAALETWGDLVPPRQRPDVVRRAWVWLPNQARPGLYPIDDGTIRLHEKA